MAQFPVTDDQGIIDGLNYVLSGPVGLGQTLVGFSSDDPAYQTGNFRPPFTSNSTATLMGTSVALASATWLDGRTWRYDFSAAQPSAPFQVGNALYVTGVTPADYNGSYLAIGVVECTTTYVIARTSESYPDPGPGTGGTVELYNETYSNALSPLSTDCNGKVVVNGIKGAASPINFTAAPSPVIVNDRVVLNAQLNNTLTYSSATPATFEYRVQINRYTASPNDDPINPEFYFNVPGTTISEQVYTYTLDATAGGIIDVAPAGVKVAYAAPVDGAFDPAVDVVVVGVNAATGTGNAANLRIQIAYGAAGAYTAANTRVTVNAPGDSWTAGSTIVIPGTTLGGATPVNDLTLTVNTVSAGTATIGPVETIFTGVVDQPEPGYYWYIVDTNYYSIASTGPVVIDTAELGFRSFTAQVVKP